MKKFFLLISVFFSFSINCSERIEDGEWVSFDLRKEFDDFIQHINSQLKQFEDWSAESESFKKIINEIKERIEKLEAKITTLKALPTNAELEKRIRAMEVEVMALNKLRNQRRCTECVIL